MDAMSTVVHVCLSSEQACPPPAPLLFLNHRLHHEARRSPEAAGAAAADIAGVSAVPEPDRDCGNGLRLTTCSPTLLRKSNPLNKACWAGDNAGPTSSSGATEAISSSKENLLLQFAFSGCPKEHTHLTHRHTGTHTDTQPDKNTHTQRHAQIWREIRHICRGSTHGSTRCC